VQYLKAVIQAFVGLTKYDFLELALIFIWRAFYLIAARHSTLSVLRIRYHLIMNTQADDSPQRVFFALWPDSTVRAALSAWQPALKRLCGGREMRPDTLHLTLVFLGDIASARLEALQLAAGELSAQGFDLSLDEARYWVHNHILYNAPRSIPPQLSHLVRALEKSLLRHDFKFELREYHPHVTLLRKANWQDHPLPDMAPVHWRVRDFVLLQSAPHDGVACYRVLAKYPLSI